VVAIVFDHASSVAQWHAVDDRVMGGVSSSRMRFDPEGHALFEGAVSLAQGGGFASVRMLSSALQATGIQGYTLNLCGDGRRYKLGLRTDTRFDGITYQAEFETAAGQWETHELAVGAFVPRFRGRAVPDAPAFSPNAVCQVGLMIADKQAGPFALALRSIRCF
jgi:NADH dehydrogenase [ubiquinone] 1 alpha subcomplex assembly factor 1